MEAMLTMAPPPCSFITCMAARVPQKVPSTVVAKLACQSAVVMVSTPPQVKAMALLTITSRRPNSAAVDLIAPTKDSSLLTSATRYAALPPALRICATTSCNGSSRRPQTTTVAPSAAILSAVAAPIPEPPPVTKATLFCMRAVMIFSSEECRTAVDGDVLAGDETGIVAGQEGHHARHFLGLAQAAQRDGGDHRLHPLIGDAGHHWRVGRAGHYGVDADLLRRQLAGQAAGQAHHAGLGSDVVAGAFAGQRTGAGEVDDGAGGALGDHQPGSFAGAQEGTLEVDADHPIPVLHRGIQETVDRAGAGVVDQHIQASGFVGDTLHGSLDRGLVHHVAHHGVGAPLEVGDAGGDGFFIDVGGIDHGALLHELADDGSPHALGGSGHEGNLVIEFHRCSYWPNGVDPLTVAAMIHARPPPQHRPLRLS